MERENARMPTVLVLRPRESWSLIRVPEGLVEVWQSRDFLVQVYERKNGAERLSILRTSLNAEGTRWKDGISWEQLQRLKHECGRGDRFAVEIYPADADVVNVANLRHLWVLDEPPSFAWRTRDPEVSPRMPYP